MVGLSINSIGNFSSSSNLLSVAVYDKIADSVPLSLSFESLSMNFRLILLLEDVFALAGFELKFFVIERKGSFVVLLAVEPVTRFEDIFLLFMVLLFTGVV